MNLSNNIASYIQTYDIDDAESNSSITFSIFINNTQKIQYCCSFFSGEHLKITNCNYLKNKGFNTSIDTLLLCKNSILIENCCILENDCKNIFHSTQGTITVNDCFCDSYSSEGLVVINATKNSSDTNSIFEIDAKKCFDFSIVFHHSQSLYDDYPYQWDFVSCNIYIACAY